MPNSTSKLTTIVPGLQDGMSLEDAHKIILIYIEQLQAEIRFLELVILLLPFT